jgi:hypothetical protein
MMQAAKWLVNTDAGLLVRIAAGVIFFLVMAIVDINRHGRRATHWREYLILLTAVAIALLGAIGYRGGLVWFSADFGEMVAHDDFRPYRFMAVYGVHLGGYIGGALGTLWAVRSILMERTKIKDSPSPAQ